MDFQYLIGLVGMAAFAITAVLAVAPRGIDIYSACVLGIVTAIGGGTIRDMVLDAPVFCSMDPNYIWVALIASLVTVYAYRFARQESVYRLMLYTDGLGVALFAIQGANKAWGLGFGLPVGPVILGVVTAVGGGIIRDVLAGQPTLLMSQDIYAFPVSIGCALYVLLLYLVPEHSTASGVICATLIFAMRAAVIRWDLRLPDWVMVQTKRS